MDVFQDDMRQWDERLNTAALIFKEQMDMILEARNNVARCQHIITQKNNQIAHLQVQVASTSTVPVMAPIMMSTLLYSKKVEIFTDSGEYDGSKVKFEEWWEKAQAWLKVNKHPIPDSSQDAVRAILS